METFDVYDENRYVTGKIWERGKPLEKGGFRLVVHICIFDKNERMLIQQRNINRESLPGLWDFTTGGAAKVGESSKQAAERELFEEMGISHDFSNERAYMTINFEDGFDDYYILKKDIDIKKDVKFTDGEVQDSKWATKDEILKMIDNGSFVKYKKEVIALLFAFAKSMGARQ